MEKNIFINPAPSVSETDIDIVQKRLGIQFPKEYKDHLLSYNGGQPKRGSLSGLGQVNEPYSAFTSSIDFFYALYPDLQNHHDNIEKKFNIFQGRMPSHIFPIARDIAGNQICISFGSNDYGYIYFWDHEEEADEEPDYRNLTLLSKSFNEFISKLEPDEDAE